MYNNSSRGLGEHMFFLRCAALGPDEISNVQYRLTCWLPRNSCPQLPFRRIACSKQTNFSCIVTHASFGTWKPLSQLYSVLTTYAGGLVDTLRLDTS